MTICHHIAITHMQVISYFKILHYNRDESFIILGGLILVQKYHLFMIHCLLEVRGHHISSRFFRNSETFSWKFQENIENVSSVLNACRCSNLQPFCLHKVLYHFIVAKFQWFAGRWGQFWRGVFYFFAKKIEYPKSEFSENLY